MKRITSFPIVILTLLACSLVAASASEPIAVRPSIYRVPLSNATNVLLTENPMGNPEMSQSNLDSMVEKGEAESGSMSEMWVAPGVQLTAQTWLGKLEIVLATDKKAVAINYSLTSDDISLSGQGAVFFGDSLFAGASKTKDGRSVIFIYLTPFQR